MNTSQAASLKKIMVNFDRDYQLSEQLYDRHVELIDSIKNYDLEKPFDALLRKGVRREVMEEAMLSPEFEELLATYRRELTGIIAKWDLADQIDSARTAA